VLFTNSEDRKLLGKHLVDLRVEDLDQTNGFRIIFVRRSFFFHVRRCVRPRLPVAHVRSIQPQEFSTNKYLEKNILWKDFRYNDDGTEVVTSSGVQWKPGQVRYFICVRYFSAFPLILDAFRMSPSATDAPRVSSRGSTPKSRTLKLVCSSRRKSSKIPWHSILCPRIPVYMTSTATAMAALVMDIIRFVVLELDHHLLPVHPDRAPAAATAKMTGPPVTAA
jgi:hypothetical protein